MLRVPWLILGKSLVSGLPWFLYCLLRGMNLNARRRPVGVEMSGVDQLLDKRGPGVTCGELMLYQEGLPILIFQV